MASPRTLNSVIGQVVLQHVAFVGPLGVGKTTAVRSISDVPIVNTDVVRSADPVDGRRVRKLTTTVGIDYGECNDANGERVALLGTPGQSRFFEARNAAMPEHTMVVLWLYGDHDQALEECREWVQLMGEDVWPRLTVAVTRREDAADPPDLARYEEVLAGFHPRIGLTTGDPRDPRSVTAVVEAALERGRELAAEGGAWRG